MTWEEIVERNRKNAQKSTGPKTVSGKAKVADNARRHGATSRPDPEVISTWLKVILDNPTITPEHLTPTDERGVRALLLAESEARLAITERALRDFEAELPLGLKFGVQLSWTDIAEGFLSGSIPRPNMNLSYREISKLIRTKKDDYKVIKRRHRLLKRYAAEARSQRRKALLAWLAASTGTEEAA
jgi:hypothetical protein